MTAPLDLDALEQAAACTHGDPWYSEDSLRGSQSFIAQDRAFIASANPDVVLELVRRLRAAEAAAAANLATLNLKAGDMLVVRIDADLHPNREQFVAFANGLRGMLPEGVQAMVLPDAVNVSAMPEDAMRRAGWVRADPG